MKKFLIVLAVISLVFTGCNSETEVVEGPAAALQGKWFWTINDIIVDNDFIEFKGNTMKYHHVGPYNKSKGTNDITDWSGPFTCDGKTIYVHFTGTNGDDPNGYDQHHIVPYTTGEIIIGNFKYSAGFFIGSNSELWANTRWVKSDSAKQKL